MTSLDDAAAKLAEFREQYVQERSRRWHVMRGEGDGATLYFGNYRGARYVSVDLRGFDGWRSSRWMPGGWEFLNPTLRTGRLYMDRSRSWSREVLIPSKVHSFYYWRIRPSGRRYMRDHGHEEER